MGTAKRQKIHNRKVDIMSSQKYYKKQQPTQATTQPIKFITIAQFCKLNKIKLQNFTHKDYTSLWYYCKANNLASFGTECDDIDKSFEKLRKIIDRNQELLIF